MTYRPRRLAPHDAAGQLQDLVPWRHAAALLEVKPRTLARWIDRGRLGFVTVDGRRLVSIREASTVEASTRRRGGKRA